MADVDRRRKNVNWNVADGNGNPLDRNNGTHLAVLMDIRDELKKLNELLHCDNFISIPRTLRTISRKIPTRKPQRRGLDWLGVAMRDPHTVE